MTPVQFEVAAFTSFLVISLVAQSMHSWKHRKELGSASGHLLVAVGASAFVQSLHEYAVHFIVYSGHVIPGGH